MITCNINLDFKRHFSSHNPKLSPKNGRITCKYLYKIYMITGHAKELYDY